MSTEPATEPTGISWTPRQRQVLDLLARGYTNGQLAEALGISLDGAKWHVSEVIAKLDVDTREEAAEHWRRERGIGRRLRDFPRRMSARALGWWAAAAGTATAGVVAVAAIAFLGDDSNGAATTGWERLPDPPLEPRATAVLVWTGDEVLVIGGDTYRCPPAAGCVGPDHAALSDGAAYNPETNQWRTIADSPAPIEHASTAFVDDSVYLLASIRDDSLVRRTAFLRYTPATDSWEELHLPMDPGHFAHIVGSGTRIVIPAATHERIQLPDLVFDAATGEWSQLPSDPLAPSFDRTVFAHDGKLWLMALAIDQNRGATGPNLTKLARYDFEAGTWEQLPETGMLGGYLAAFPVVVEENTAYVAQVHGGGGWSGTYPYGGIIDLESGAWRELPGWDSLGDSQFTVGAVGREGGAYGIGYVGTGGGWVFDVRDGSWTFMERLHADESVERPAIAAGRDAFYFSGVNWSTPGLNGELLGDAWIWRAPD